MVTAIRIYVEGGGNTKHTKARLRQGFHGFLAGLRELARQRHIDWDVVVSGSRRDAFDDFVAAQGSHPDSWILLLVDAEGAVEAPPRAHLQHRDGWDLSAAGEDQVHLMVQAMEAWLLADPEALADYYGQDFNRKALPKRHNLEEEPKANLCAALEAATRHTQKGEYGKIAHASDLLARVDVCKSQARAPHCKRLFDTLRTKLES
jgi:hypothetical protein